MTSCPPTVLLKNTLPCYVSQLTAVTIPYWISGPTSRVHRTAIVSSSFFLSFFFLSLFVSFLLSILLAFVLSFFLSLHHKTTLFWGREGNDNLRWCAHINLFVTRLFESFPLILFNLILLPNLSRWFVLLLSVFLIRIFAVWQIARDNGVFRRVRLGRDIGDRRWRHCIPRPIHCHCRGCSTALLVFSASESH